ncbi:hypothetical protein [Flavobacterium sp.]|uniref:hypothetical protein n=1 Tax=Flavobacterium sp. TaxID=239 RepID=UPI00374CC9ED
MKAIIKSFFIFLFINNSYSQSKVKASIIVDSSGNMYVSQNLVKKVNDTILFNEKIKLYNEKVTKLAKPVKVLDRTFYQFLINDTIIEYPFTTTKNKYDDYTIGKNFFYTSLNYLGLHKSLLNEKKRFDLHFAFSRSFRLVYPTKKDLEGDFNYIPIIIAGKYKENLIKGFKIYSFENENIYDRKIKKIALILDKSFQFYRRYYGDKVRKPKIVFLPFVTSLQGKVGENIILLDYELLKKKEINTHVIVQNLASLWWSINSTKFKNFVYNESITEFMSLQFLKSSNNKNELLNSLNVKNYNCEGLFNSMGELKKDSYLLSHNILPLLFVNEQNKNSDYFKEIASFHKLNENRMDIDKKDLDFFLKAHKLDSVFENLEFMDFSIEKNIDKPEIIIKYDKNIEGLVTVPLQIMDSNNKVYIENLIFSNEKQTFTKSIKNIKKIIIDPEFTILQSSNLNDVWIATSDSYFSKNKYFDFEKLNAKALQIGNILIEYLMNQNNDIFGLINDNISKNKEIVLNIKNDLKLSDVSKIEGASIFHEEGKKIIEFKILKKINSKNKLFVIRLFVNESLTSITKIVYNEPLFDYRKN